MGILSQSHSLFKTVNALQKASPVIVHLLMIIGVALYTLFGAVVMQKLETKTVLRNRRATTELSAFETGVQSNETAAAMFDRANSSELFEASNSTEMGEQTARGKREIAQFVRSRKCVLRALKKLVDMDCDQRVMDRMTVRMIEHCYSVVVRNERSLDGVVFERTADGLQIVGDEHVKLEPWTFSDAVLFTFTVITTIGYGNIAPKSFAGRLFCIVYGFIGIPFTLLAIADFGRFISELIDASKLAIHKRYKRIRRRFRSYFRPGGAPSMLSLASVKLSAARKDEELTKLESGETNIEEIQKLNSGDLDGAQAEDEEKKEEEEELEPIGNTLPLMSIFILYSLLGAVLLASYEPEMTFFKAVYFIFISLTSIGLGDVIPRQETYLGLTLVYIAVGLALTTIAIEIAADYLKRLHYFGRKVENVGGIVIWFGSKTLTVKQLVKNLGDQFNLPVTTIKTLDLDQFVDDAIKVEAGELETLRPPPIGPSDVMLESPVTFADEDEEPWEPMKTPTPSPTPPPREPTPPKEPSPIPTPPHEPSPEPEPPREPTPPPPPPPPKEPTAEELAALKRRSYSEEAYRRYLAYQKQWRKFRQTQQQFAGPSGRRRSSAATSQASASSSGHRYAPVRSETQESTEEPPKE